MKFVTFTDIRKETLERLQGYRTDRQMIHVRGRGARRRVTLACWVRAVEQVLSMYQQIQPEKARAMERLFGLRYPVPRCQNNRARMHALAKDFCIAESTMYKWRDEIVFATMLAAAQNGAVRPFQQKD